MLLIRGSLILAVFGLGCAGPGPPDPTDKVGQASGGQGSQAGTLEVRPFMFTPIDQPTLLLHDGDPIELYAAPQGGHVITAGAQVRGLDSDFIEIRGQVRDPETGLLVTEGVRTVVMAPVDGEPEWTETDRRSRSQMAHMALCPRYEDKPIEGNPYELTISVTELYADDSTGSATVSIVPTCMQTDPSALAQCQCECEGGYILGKCGQ
ncbi:MAG TPA: hypothetical protein VGP93_17955 [Polyangiaceae bacterium]|nr:hypothetical protein [Polyangiaceae bacterium]